MQGFKRKQSGLTLVSTLIVGMFLVAALMLGLKLVPVFTEYSAVKGAFKSIISSTDVQQSATVFRNAFAKYAQINDINSVDPQTIVVTKEDGRAYLSVDYRREVELFGNCGLYFDFSVASEGAKGK
ncbi:DUF4845 domain-containing protein [Viridibacterium curvum]|uniref:DUF4845 domain-containing protein n=1 Tax=Viridibacterium curvum TaxID=1101404 RepID=A0ABP9QW55_9RHOO